MNAPETHTPTPWSLGNLIGVTGPTTASVDGPTVCGRDRKYEIVTCGMDTIAICPNQGDSGSEAHGSGKANAALIVEAVNSHAALAARVSELEAENEQTNALFAVARKTSASLSGRVAELEAALIEIADSTRNCVHDGGFDREFGPVGCLLGDKCLCIGLHPIAVKALNQGRDNNG